MRNELAYRLDLRLLRYDEETMKSRTRDLTREQRKLLKLIALGLTNRQIAERTGISDKTVRNNLTRLYRAMNVLDRESAIRFYDGS